MNPSESQIRDNTSANRYEITVDGRTAFLEYRRDGDIIAFPHTETPEELRGQGLAGMLTKHALEEARMEGLRVVPECSYVEGYLQKHPEYADLTVN